MNTANLLSHGLASSLPPSSNLPPQSFQQSLASPLYQICTIAIGVAMLPAIQKPSPATTETPLVLVQTSSVDLPRHSFQQLDEVSLQLGSHQQWKLSQGRFHSLHYSRHRLLHHKPLHSSLSPLIHGIYTIFCQSETGSGRSVALQGKRPTILLERLHQTSAHLSASQ